jgi:hypothetical protein
LRSHEDQQDAEDQDPIANHINPAPLLALQPWIDRLALQG